MNKTAIKNFAVWARRELIERVSQKALQYGIEEKNIQDSKLDTVNGKLLTKSEKEQRQALIKKVNAEGFQPVMEEVAYTWFNRFIALRFMEVNDYLPSHVRVFTDDENNFKPQLLKEAINVDFEGLDKQKIYSLKEADDDEELYKYLLITQCNALNSVLPRMFQKINDYTELLFPDFILRDDSILSHLVSDIDIEDWNPTTENGQIEIIGWLYQYYISEKHEEVIDPLHGKVIAKKDIPAATQLFTTDWVVRYIVDNSVGRYWLERNPNSKLNEKLTYYVSRRTTPETIVDEKITPQDVTVFDPCMGSGHFLIYAFEVLMQIYLEYGYSERDAADEILQHNLFGLDIDERASQLAYFSVMMKARQYDQRIFARNINPKVFAIQESDEISESTITAFINGNKDVAVELNKLISNFKNAKELGSIIQLPKINLNILTSRVEEIKVSGDLFAKDTIESILPLIQVAELLEKKYAVVDTNPPYLSKYSKTLKAFINENYENYKGDLFSVFIYRNFEFCKIGGFSGMMTPFVWMFIQTYEKLRTFIIDEKFITTILQLEYSAYEEATVPICTFVMKNLKTDELSVCYRLADFPGGMQVQNEKFIEGQNDNNCKYFYESKQEHFNQIPGKPIAFWATEKDRNAFVKGNLLQEVAMPRQGMATTNNNKFLRLWFEVKNQDINFECKSEEDTLGGVKWYPYNKGGEYRKWYGNNDYIVNFKDKGQEICDYIDENSAVNHKGRVINRDCYFKHCITWSLISSSDIAFRFKPDGYIFDISGMSCFANSDSTLYYLLALNNTKIVKQLLTFLAPTLNFQVGDICRLPVIEDVSRVDEIVKIVKENIQISKEDWDTYEASWDFCTHPFIKSKSSLLKETYKSWELISNQRFQNVLNNEIELNKRFIEIYNLQDELTPNLDDSYITINKACLEKDIKSFISYAVGCMFGRYSLDKEGLIYAGGDFDPSNYKTFAADKDAIIPICDDDSFEDDIVTRFEEFVATVYGKETLEENLRFIADALGGNGTSRDVIRNYFITGFYKDHCQIYQKRPIYWLFDSGKNNGFKCLIYMHRYRKETIAQIRTDYIHVRQGQYSSMMDEFESNLKSASGSEKIKLQTKLKETKAKAEELHKYEEKIHHLADEMISIDLDDGVKHNYEIFKDVLAAIK